MQSVSCSLVTEILKHDCNSQIIDFPGGGTGFIGKRLVSVLKTKGHDVTIISRTSGNGKISWVRLYLSLFCLLCEHRLIF